MSKYQFHQSDIYQPGTELPKNRLNITDAELLHAVESNLLAIQRGYAPIDYSRAWQDDAEVGNNYIRAPIDCVQRADHRLLTQPILAGLTPLQDDQA